MLFLIESLHSHTTNHRMKNSLLIAIFFFVGKSLVGQSFDINKEATSLKYCEGKFKTIQKFKSVKGGTLVNLYQVS